jgi:hypothetical protein
MSSCDNSNIRKNYIVTGIEQDILSACTGFFTNDIYPCTGDTIIVHSDILSANTINSTVYLSGGTNLLDIFGSMDTFVTGTTLDSNLATLTRNDSVDVLLLSGGSNVTLSNPSANQINIDVSIPPDTNTFVSASTLSGSTLVLTRNDGIELTTDLSSLPITDLGKILFVSENGDDSTGKKGDINKPFRNIYGAKSGATTGDTVYVFPGTWNYDNTNSVSNPYNGNIETQVNLWKDGVNYYFSPGSKVVFSNQTVTGDRMYLFSPMSSNYETCNIYGELEWEGSSIGANSSNGHTHIFYIDENQPLNEAYSCNMEIKSAISISSQPINGGSVHTGSTTTYFNLKADTVACDYSQGQSGSGGGIQFWGGGKQYNNVEVEEVRSNFFTFYLRTDDGQDGFNLNVISNRLYSNGTAVILNRGLIGDININFKEAFVTNALLQSQNNTFGTTVINGTVIDNVGTTTYPIFNLTSSNQCKTIFNGILKPKVNSGNGRRLIQISQPNNDMIFKGDVFYESTASTTSNMFNLLSDSELVFDGNVSGTFSGKIGNVRNGKLIIKNCHFESSTTNNVLLDNDVTTSTGTTSIRNSTFLLNNSTTDLCDGQYLNTFISSSNIKNVGSSDIFTNNTSTGLLQIHNSNLVSVSGNTINISGSSPLIASNLVSNTSVIATNISGIITELTELDIE